MALLRAGGGQDWAPIDNHLAENWRLVLIEEEKEVDLAEVLESRVFRFWSELTYRIYIGEG